VLTPVAGVAPEGVDTAADWADMVLRAVRAAPLWPVMARNTREPYMPAAQQKASIWRWSPQE